MAIDILRGIDHTYRHDLEASFYVLLWLCARWGWRLSRNPKGQPKTSMLSRWYTGTYREIAQNKRGDMVQTGLEDIMEEFPLEFDCVKPLCRELRGVLFPMQNGDLFTGTRKDPEILYEPITKAFDKAIDDMKAMEK